MILPPRARGLWLCILGLSLAGPAMARPAPLLGPAGPAWFGPLPPPPAGRGAPSPGVAVVDPVSGALWLEVDDLFVGAEPDPLRLGRAWDGQGWRWLGVSALAVASEGVTWSLPGQPSRAFPPIWPDPTQAVCQAGSEVEEPGGAVLACLPEGYAVRLPGDAAETFDATGRLVARTAPGRAGLQAGWSEDGLAWLQLDDLRIDLAPPLVREGRKIVLATGPAGEEARYETDGLGRLTAVTAADGARHRYHYDDAGRLRSVVWSDGSSLVVRRDEHARVLGLEGPGSQRWRFEWDETGLARAWDGRGAPWQVRREPEGITLVDPAGRSATALIEGGRLAGWRDPSGRSTAVIRDDRGLPGQIQDATGARWALAWDAGTQLSQITDPTGGRWRLLRDPVAREARIVDPAGRTRRVVTDALGRVRAIADAGVERRFHRDAAGRVVEIVEGSGSTVRIERDASGRIEGLEDATGASTRLTHLQAGAPSRIDDPGGGSWKLAFDIQGRVCGLDAPDGSHTDWTRAPGGRLAAVRQDQAQARFDRRADGAITRMLDPLGRITGWVLDATGHARATFRGDGVRIALDLDGWGLPRAIEHGAERLEVTRDALGRPAALLAQAPGGAADHPLLAWRRDPAGRVVSVAWPAGELALARDPAGAVRGVRLGAHAWTLERDLGGRLAAVEGDGRRWELRRDATGRLTSVQAPTGGLEMALDPRGLPRQADTLGLALRWRRDAAGRPVQIEGPGEVAVGIQRDAAGRPVLVRLPGGVLLRVDHSGTSRTLTLEDAAGRILAQVGIARDALGRLRASWDDQGERRFRWGPLDELLSIEEAVEAWSVFPGRREGPQGAPLVATDVAGRPTSATLGTTATAWGIATREVCYERDERGFLARVSGDRGIALLDHDPIGRLERVRILDPEGAEEVASFLVRWDPFGRPELIEGPAGKTLLRFLGGRLLGLQEGARPALLLQADAGLDLFAGAGGHTVLWRTPGVAASLAWSSVEARGADRPGPGGLRSLDSPGALGLQDRVQLFPGGPLVGPFDALDPVSGTPTAAPPGAVPWQPTGWPDPQALVRWPDPDGAADVPWDPSAWGEPDPWSDPLGLLVRLGEIPPPFPGTPWTPGVAVAPLPWLPASFEGRPPSPLPPVDALPLAEEPVTALFLAAALNPTLTPPTAGVVRALLEPDLAGLPVGWPGLPSPEAFPGATR